MIKQVLKYQGNNKYICILCLGENDKLFVFYCLTGDLSVDINKEETDFEINTVQRIIFSYTNKYEIKIPILATKNSHFYHIIEINDLKEYDHICAVVESLV